MKCRSLLSPFLSIGKKSDKERLHQLEKGGLLTPHPAGDLIFAHILFAVNDFSRSIEPWKEWLQLEEGEAYIAPEWNAEVRTLKLLGGDLHFAKPIGKGDVQSFLHKRGPAPMVLRLTGHERLA